MPWYFITVTVYFWLPILALGIWLLPKQDAITLKALAWSIVVFWPLTAAMEYLCLYLDIWNFSQELDPLLGISLFGAPIEEFLFWFGAPVFVLLAYFAFDRRFPAPGRGVASAP